MSEPLSRILQATILVVEDNLVNQVIVVESLRKYGFHKVIGVDGGREALEALQTLEPNLIITDLIMPDIDGFLLCQNIRNTPKLKNIPILALTALEDEEARLSIFDMGASDLVRKPVTEEELIARCCIHLEKGYILKDLHDYQQRVKEDLSHARAMQNMLMPNNAAISDVEFAFGLGISSLFAPSFTIGGDFWGLKPLKNHKLAIYIGDFTGHGVTAAINVFRLCGLLDKLPISTLSTPSETLRMLNQQLYAVLPIQLFATMFYGVIDTKKNRMTYCIAGCPPPLKLSSSGRYELLQGSGLPIAAVKNTKYREHLCDFLPRDALLLYSDALIETPSELEEYLDIEKLGARLGELMHDAISTEDILQHIISHFSHFATREVEDDLTLNVYMRYS